MNSNTISAIVIAVEFALRAVCVYAILRVTLTLFRINKNEKLEKERDAALTWLPHTCGTCNVNYTKTYCDFINRKSPGYPCPNWEFCGKTYQEVYGDDDK